MKKIICILFISMMFCGEAFSQTKETVFDENNLYHRALQAVLEKRAEQYKNILTKERIKNTTIIKMTNYDYFTSNRNVIDLPDQIGNFTVDYLNWEELYLKFKRYKKENKNDQSKAIPVMEVFPMKNTGSKIEIRFTDKWYSRKGNHISMGLEGGSIVTFIFDCEKDKFIIENVEFWGI